MQANDELRRAALLLVVGLSTNALLSGCGRDAVAQTQPTQNPGGSAAPTEAELRNAVDVVKRWQQTDPVRTARVLQETGLFACNAQLDACASARTAFNAMQSQGAHPVAAPTNPPTPRPPAAH